MNTIAPVPDMKTFLSARFEMRTEEERNRFYASIDTREKAVSLLQDSIQKLVSALNKVSPEELAREVQTPWGEISPLYRMANICGSHMTYHDGQINYYPMPLRGR